MSKARWIIVEDDLGIMTMVSAMCQIWDVEPIKLNDGFAAMAWIDLYRDGKHTGPPPELALIDIRMPGPQGHEIAKELRRIPEFRDMAIIMMTAFRMSEEEEKEVMTVSQADLLLMKPLPGLFEFNRMVIKTIEARKAKVRAELEAKAEAKPEGGAGLIDKLKAQAEMGSGSLSSPGSTSRDRPGDRSEPGSADKLAGPKPDLKP